MPTDVFDPANCACFSLRRAARLVTQAYDRALRPAGIHATQFTLLSVLGKSAGHDGIAMQLLSKKLGMDRTTLTRNLALAERAGWVSVTVGDDRRHRCVALTEAGRARRDAAEPYWRKAQQRFHDDLGGDAFTRLIAMTGRLNGI